MPPSSPSSAEATVHPDPPSTPEPTTVIPDPNPNPEPAPIIPDPAPESAPAPPPETEPARVAGVA